MTETLIHGHTFRIPSKYTDLRFLGAGAHSIVCSAFDAIARRRVAVKKLALTAKGCTRAILREIRILARLNHENIVAVYDTVSPTSGENNFDAVYLVQELLSIDLRRLLRSQKLTSDHVTLFLYQLLKGAKYIHSANVIHRDIKPSNILIDINTLVLKICDFGLARIVDSAYSHSGFLTETVCTQWYRAPEVMLTPKQYTNKIDIWSIGCVFGEMLSNGETLFPGANEFEQIRLILNTVALSESDLASIPEGAFSVENRDVPVWGDSLQGVSSETLDLLGKMLTFDAGKRITAEEALAHSYLSELASPRHEPVASQPFYIESEADDHLPENQIREKILLSCTPPKKSLETMLEECHIGEGGKATQ